jgi:hypothetical protein
MAGEQKGLVEIFEEAVSLLIRIFLSRMILWNYFLWEFEDDEITGILTLSEIIMRIDNIN